MISRGNSDTFGGKLALNGRRRSVPVEFSIANEGNNKCVDVRYGSYSNGSDVIQYSCTGATSHRWIYSDEGQLIGHVVMAVGMLDAKVRQAEELACEPISP